MRDDDDVDVLYVAIDVIDEEVADKSEEDESWHKAKVYIW